MAFPERLAIASTNRHKLRELARICGSWPVEWITVEMHPGRWPDIEEPHETYLENAAEKARAVAEALGVAAVADDSGVEVDALGGRPGARSARFAGEGATDDANLAKLLDELEGVPAERRGARYRCVAALAWPDGRLVHAEATCEGTIGSDRRGTRGFGYDPAFVPDGETRTMAELTDEEKDRISHRGRAFRALAELLSGPAIRDLPSALANLVEIGEALRGRRLVVALDYDGTLTPIVAEPEMAVLAPDVRDALRELARLVPVAVISGRDLDDVRRMVDLPELWYAGSHGFDIAGPADERHERAAAFLPDLDAAEHDLAPLADAVPGARLERKRFAIAVHVRQVDERRVSEVERAVAEVAARHPRLRITGGKRVLELRPDEPWDKGAALAWLLDVLEPGRPDVVPVYVGDDETDEDAFRAIAERGFGVVVRGEGDERPSAARYALDDPGEVAELLRRLRALLER